MQNVCRSYGDLPPCDVLRHVVGSIGWTRAWGAGSRERVARYLAGRGGRVRADVAPPALQPRRTGILRHGSRFALYFITIYSGLTSPCRGPPTLRPAPNAIER
jgi:hypothetical protein